MTRGQGGEVLHHVIGALRCPHDRDDLALVDRAVGCAAGHRFDVARHGYVNLSLRPPPAGAETAGMVAARHAFLATGHQRPLIEVLATTASQSAQEEAVIVDLGAGTGHHLAAVLDGSPGAVGLAVDISKHAARRAAKAHPRIGAIVGDVWDSLPVRDAVAEVVLNVFAPRNVTEIGRILAPDGRFVAVTPTVEHLSPLGDELGLLRIDAGKEIDLDEQVTGILTPVDRQQLAWPVLLDRAGIVAAVGMGPSAWHLDLDELERRVRDLPDPFEVTLSVVVSTYRHGGD